MMRAHFTIAISILALASAGVVPSATAGLVAHWAFDEGSGYTASDSANGWDGTLTPSDATGPAWTTGMIGGALQFDGTGDYVSTSYPGIGGSNARSVAFWVKTTDTSNHGILAWGDDATNGEKWHVRLNDSSANGLVGGVRTENQGGYIIGDVYVADGAWHHIAAVFSDDGSPNVQDVLLYVDGNPVGVSGSKSQSLNTDISSGAAKDVTVGRRTQAGAQLYFTGQLDDVRIYDNALSAAEVQALATVSAPVIPGVHPYVQAVLGDGAIAYWRLGEASGSTAANSGSLGAVVDGSYSSVVSLGQVGLIVGDMDTAVRFNGSNQSYVDVPDHAAINSGGPYVNKAVELWFRADDVQARQVLYEQGGTTRGLNIFIEGGKVYVGAWNTNNDDSGQTTPWELFLGTDIVPDATYMVDLVLTGDGSGKNGTLNGYLNGEPFDPSQPDGLTGVGRLFGHAADIAIGGRRNDSRFPGAAPTGDGNWFAGIVDDVSLYNTPLSADQIAFHYFAATAVPEPATLVLLGMGFAALARRRRRRTGSRTLTLLLLAALLGLGGSQAQAGLVARWNLDEGTGSVAADSSGNHYDGALKNFEGDEWVTTGLAPIPGGTAAALRFDGTGGGAQEFIVADGSAPGSTAYKGVLGAAPRTVSAWIKVGPSDNPDGEIVSWGNNTSQNKWIFRVQDDNGTDGAIRLEVNGGYIVGSTNIMDDQWHHVVAVLPAGGSNVDDVHLYVDGVDDGYSAIQSNGINTTSSANVRIGLGHGNHYFEGLMDEVRIYDNDLSATEIRGLSAASAPTSYPEAVLANHPIAYWRLGEASGTTAVNLSSLGTALDGTYNGGFSLAEPGLVPVQVDTAVRFDGADGWVSIPSNGALNTNTAGPYRARSVEMWFQPSGDVLSRQVLYEEGGATKGLNIYIEDGKVYVGAWNDHTGTAFDWGPVFLSKEINENAAYMVDLVLNGETGTLEAYLDGKLFGSQGGLGDLFDHTGRIGIGGMDNASYFENGGADSGNSGWYFAGVIDDVSVYNLALSLDEIALHYSYSGVPEPATLVLLGMGFAALARRRRRG